MNSTNFVDIEGAIIKLIDIGSIPAQEVCIHTDRGVLKLYHEQDCCESVDLVDYELDGDLTGARVIRLLELEQQGQPTDEYVDSSTWTFYRLETTKGDLWMRWCGESNGYYSEAVCVRWDGFNPYDAAAMPDSFNTDVKLPNNGVADLDEFKKQYDQLLVQLAAARLQ